MKYQTPEVIALATAKDAIRSMGKGENPPADLSEDKPTNGAYEADE